MCACILRICELNSIFLSCIKLAVLKGHTNGGGGGVGGGRDKIGANRQRLLSGPRRERRRRKADHSDIMLLSFN